MKFNVVIWIVLVSNTLTFELILSSNGYNQTIHEVPKYSCRRSTFTIYYQNFTLYLTKLPTNIKNVVVKFQQLNNQSIITPDDNYAAIQYLNASKYLQDQEITQTIWIKMEQQVYSRKLYIFKTSNKQKTWSIQLPTISIILTQVFALLFIILLPYNMTYRRFKPISLNIPLVIIYILLLFIGTQLALLIGYDHIHRWVIYIFAFICSFLYVQDLISKLIKNKRWLVDIMSFIIVVLLFALDSYQLQDAWFLNDIIACLLAGALIKFVVIKRIKSSVIPLLILWLFFILRQFALDFRITNFTETLKLQIIPLYLQLPSFNEHGFACSAFGSSKIISFGTILHYSIRVDKFLSIRFYQVLTIIIITLCILLQLLLNILLDDIPTMQFLGVILFIPFSIVLTTFFANKRGQWAEIWFGSFYDMSVNRQTLTRQIDVARLSQQFGLNLTLNNSVSSSADPPNNPNNPNNQNNPNNPNNPP